MHALHFDSPNGAKDLAEQRLAAGALLRRKRQEHRIVRQQKRGPDARKVRLDLRLFELVALVGHDDHRAAGGMKPRSHRLIVGRGLVAGVDDHDAERDARGVCEEVLHELAPACALRLGDAGVAIARQVDEVCPAVDAKIVHMDGLAGLRADAGKVLTVEQPVDDRGLADVRLAGKDDARQVGREKAGRADGGLEKLRLIQVQCRHGSLLTGAGSRSPRRRAHPCAPP